MNMKQRRERKYLELEQPWMVNYGAFSSISGAYLEKNTEDIGFQG
jgi:hypothetical protein